MTELHDTSGPVRVEGGEGMGDCWVNGHIEIDVPLDLPVYAPRSAKSAALTKVMDEICQLLGEPLSEHVGYGKWQDTTVDARGAAVPMRPVPTPQDVLVASLRALCAEAARHLRTLPHQTEGRDGRIAERLEAAAQGVAAREPGEPEPCGLRVARRSAGWYLGDPAWADKLIGAYLQPEPTAAFLDREMGEEAPSA